MSNALQSLHNFYTPDKLKQVSLDEVQLSDGGQFWLVTLAFPAESDSDNSAGASAKSSKPRSIKVVKIHADNGQFMALTQPKK